MEPLRQHCIDTVTSNPGCTQLFIRRAYGDNSITKKQVNSTLYALEREGLLRHEQTSETDPKPLWFAVEEQSTPTDEVNHNLTGENIVRDSVQDVPHEYANIGAPLPEF